jgi:hypothetical protein
MTEYVDETDGGRAECVAWILLAILRVHSIAPEVLMLAMWRRAPFAVPYSRQELVPVLMKIAGP